MTDQQLPIDTLHSDQPADQLQVAREEISRHYDQRVRNARELLEQKTAELQREVDAAEAARIRWETDGEITSAKATRDPRSPTMMHTEVLSIMMTADEPCHEAWKIAMAAPQDQQLRQELRRHESRVKAVQQWLAEHGHAEHPAVTREAKWW